MTTFAALAGLDLVLIGSLILVVIFVLRRSSILSQRSRGRDVLNEVRDDLRKAEQSAAGGIRRLEVRLYDYGREIEGQVQTRMTALDQLVLEAEQEAARLKQLLAESRQRGLSQAEQIYPAEHATVSSSKSDATDRSERLLAAEQRRMIVLLFDAGYSPEQIATLTSRSASLIATVLDEERMDRAA